MVITHSVGKEKNGQFRFCVDYRKLNAVTTKDCYPLPRIDETLDSMAGSKYFSTLDLASGYWQVDVDQRDRPKTAFTTGQGLFEFNVMPFGLTNAPSTFQRLMETVLAGLTWSQCLIYLDDIVVYSSTFDQHLKRLRRVFDRLGSAGLKLQPKKCRFARESVTYLGHILSAGGLEPDSKKVKAVLDFPQPQNSAELKSFLGLAGYYRRFMAGFSQIAAPLFALQKKGATFDWTSECQQAFEALKKRLTSAPILAFPDFTKPFCLATDASEKGLGAVLSQFESGKEVVIAYASRSLSGPEKNYATVEKEALAIVWAIRVFRPYLYGHQFTVLTDHCPLSWLKSVKEPTGRLARWMLFLNEYDMHITYRPGKKHSNADGLSRRPHAEELDDEEMDERESIQEMSCGAVGFQPRWNVGELQESQANDPVLAQVLSKLPCEKPKPVGQWRRDPKLRQFGRVWHQLAIKEGVLYRNRYSSTAEGQKKQELLVLPAKLVQDVLTQLHDDSGHMGIEKTMARLENRFWWLGMTQDVKDWIRCCEPCAKRKMPAIRPRAPLKSIPVGGPWEMLAMDFLGPLPQTHRGNKYLLVLADYYTKWVEAYPLPDQQARTVAQVLVDEVFCRLGVPAILHSDKVETLRAR